MLVDLAPVLALGLTALALFAADSIHPVPDANDRRILYGVTIVGVGAAAVLAAARLVTGGGAETFFAGHIVVDELTLVLWTIVAGVATLVVLASIDVCANRKWAAEYLSLIVLATAGMALMAAARSFVVLVIALELTSLPSYVLVAFRKDDERSVEAGTKYFLVGALASALLIYGVTLLYGATGTLTFEGVAAAIDGASPGLLGIGIVLVIVGLAFKTASVPVHFWAPDAYDGAPTPVSALLSSASKAAGFVIAIRVFTTALPVEALVGVVDVTLLFAVLAVATMLVGNLAAATQSSVKRMLAYSSIGHAGYVLVALASLGASSLALGGGLLHLAVYGAMNTGAFLVVALVELRGRGREFDAFAGLGERAPVAAVAMSVFLLSLAGLPVGGGFLSKYLLFAGAIDAGLWWLAVVGLATSALSVYYYARVLRAMWFESSDAPGLDATPVALYLAIVIAAVLTVGLLVGGAGVLAPQIDAATAALSP
ncbi:NADH-quinone oxidoreductase subunit N [Halococcoides cellulosivorans]|uniref:Oxidoreductase n=1 Tax=Halococcoides cellulosivorans TaxID=1679096 RepID=A0A2R4WZZ8_9EURY|nr:NADH-quinone oxidoreductase subunit N [Halococcoides cellulosivorans]AWB27089.1 oxidoreductase [Halococcoides cellulosivorans]